MDINVTEVFNQLQEILVNFALKVFGAIIVLIVGLWIIKNLIVLLI